MTRAEAREETPAVLDILGVPVVDADAATVVGRIETAIAEGRPMRVAFLNAHSANMACEDPEFHAILRRLTVLPDGIGVDMAARRLHGRPFAANLNGTDFVPALLTAVTQPLRVCLVGARPESIEGAMRRLGRIAPQHDYIAISDGYFRKTTEAEAVARIAELRPDILLVAMGVPLQEKWMARHLEGVPCTVAFGVGALFDFLSGTAVRAPLWMRHLRIEWLYRLLREPRRLARRYLLGNPLFLWRVRRAAAKAGRS